MSPSSSISQQSTFPAGPCGCQAQWARDVADSEPAADPGRTSDHTLRRLRRIEGQVRGLQRMVDENRYCADIMTQISSAHEALRAVGRELMRSHLRHCATMTLTSPGSDGEEMYDELIEMMYRLSR